MPRHTYQLAARVEAGDISDLYRGLEDRSREVTLEVFSPRASDADFGRALAEAARTAANLKHPSILHFEEVGLHASRICAARAHVDGQHLGLALIRLGTRKVVLPGPEALHIMIEVMAALGAAHAAGATHGALTPASILVGRDGRVFVTEFGALWAMQQSLALRPLVPPSRLDRRINARLDPLVLRALEPLRARRFSTCQEMEEHFRNYLSAQGAPAGRAAIGRFVSDLFPNEVTVGAVGGELPFTGEFELEPVDASRSIPGLAIEVGERVSYRAPAPADDGPAVSLPLEAFPIAAGPHKLVVVDARGRYAAKQLDVTDDDPRCPERMVKVALRHREAKD